MVGSWENAKEFLLDGWFLEWEMVGSWENAKEFLLGLRLFRRKIFVNANDFRENNCFSCV